MTNSPSKEPDVEQDYFQHGEWDWDDSNCPECGSEYTTHRVTANRVRKIIGEGDVVVDRPANDRQEIIEEITCCDCNELLYSRND
jgi:hypothetical protein